MIKGLLYYILVPLGMLYAIIMSFLTGDILALIVSAIGTIVIMFALGRLYQS